MGRISGTDVATAMGGIALAVCNTLIDMLLFHSQSGLIAAPWFVALALGFLSWLAARRFRHRKGFGYWIIAFTCSVFLIACHVSEILGQILRPCDLRLSGGMYMIRTSLATYVGVIYCGLRPHKAW